VGSFIQQMRVQLGTKCHLSLGSLYLFVLHLRYRIVLYHLEKLICLDCTLERIKMFVLRKALSRAP